jgi:predicted metal-binding membrane protein
MWTVMMVAMMLPSVTPTLWRLHVAIATAGSSRPGRLVAVASVGYFTAWAGLGMIVFPLGVAFAALAMVQPAVAVAVPLASGLLVVFAGTLQLHRVEGSSACVLPDEVADARTAPVDPREALRYGLRLGRHCIHCCAGLTAILLVVGVMDLAAMAVVTAAITLERVAAVAGARVVGVVAIAAGMLSIAQALGPGERE